MGKRWSGGGRRRVLDLSDVEAVAAEPTAAALASTSTEGVGAPARVELSNPLLGLLGEYDDEEDNSAAEDSGVVQHAAAESGTASTAIADAAWAPAAWQPCGDWQQCLDAGSQAHYYWNTRTDEVRWTPPEEPAALAAPTSWPTPSPAGAASVPSGSVAGGAAIDIVSGTAAIGCEAVSGAAGGVGASSESAPSAVCESVGLLPPESASEHGLGLSEVPGADTVGASEVRIQPDAGAEEDAARGGDAGCFRAVEAAVNEAVKETDGAGRHEQPAATEPEPHAGLVPAEEALPTVAESPAHGEAHNQLEAAAEAASTVPARLPFIGPPGPPAARRRGGSCAAASCSAVGAEGVGSGATSPELDVLGPELDSGPALDYGPELDAPGPELDAPGPELDALCPEGDTVVFDSDSLGPDARRTPSESGGVERGSPSSRFHAAIWAWPAEGVAEDVGLRSDSCEMNACADHSAAVGSWTDAAAYHASIRAAAEQLTLKLPRLRQALLASGGRPSRLTSVPDGTGGGADCIVGSVLASGGDRTGDGAVSAGGVGWCGAVVAEAEGGLGDETSAGGGTEKAGASTGSASSPATAGGVAGRDATGGAMGALRLMFQLEARRADFEAGALDPSYFWQALQSVAAQVGEMEAEGLPGGWTRAWDSASCGYYFAHAASGAAQWGYPEGVAAAGGGEGASDDAVGRQTAGGVGARDGEAVQAEELTLSDLEDGEIEGEIQGEIQGEMDGSETAGGDEDTAGGGGAASVPPVPQSDGEAGRGDGGDGSGAAGMENGGGISGQGGGEAVGEGNQGRVSDEEWIRRTAAYVPIHPDRLALIQGHGAAVGGGAALGAARLARARSRSVSPAPARSAGAAAHATERPSRSSAVAAAPRREDLIGGHAACRGTSGAAASAPAAAAPAGGPAAASKTKKRPLDKSGGTLAKKRVSTRDTAGGSSPLCIDSPRSRNLGLALRPRRRAPTAPLRAQGGLVQKWNAVRAEVATELEAEEEAAHEERRPRSLLDLEEEKRARLAEWETTLSSEEVAANSNFAPIKGDWRARVASRGKRV